MGLLDSYMMAASPAYAKRKQLEADRLARAQDNKMIRDAFGSRGLPEQNLAPDAFNMEEAKVMESLGQGEGIYNAPEQGFGLLGTGDKMPFIRSLMTAQTEGNRNLGQSLMQNELQYRAPESIYSNIISDDAGNRYGMRDGRNELIPGAQMFKRAPAALVQNIIGGEKGLNLKERVGAASTLRKDFSASNKDFNVMNQYWNRISSAQNTGAGDLALIFSYMKILDPTSTVREGEFANAENSSGVPEKIQALYNKVIGKGRLSQQQREQFKSQAGSFYNQSLEDYRGRRDEFSDIAKNYGINPSNVVSGKKYKRYEIPEIVPELPTGRGY